MELEEMKLLWEEMTRKMDRQRILTDKIILRMIEKRYQGELSKMYRAELTATLLTLFMFLLILINFGKLDFLFLKFAGIFLGIMFTTPFFTTLKTIKEMQTIDIGEAALKDVLLKFVSLKQKFFFQQKVSIIGGILTFVLGGPIALKIIFEIYALEIGISDMLEILKKGWLPLLILLVVTLIITGGVIFSFYGKLMNSAEDILKEMDIIEE